MKTFLALLAGMVVLCLGPALSAQDSLPTATPDTAVVSAKPPTDLAAEVAKYLKNEAPTPGGPLDGVAGPGHNAWMMVSTVLVLFMTLPGLALFYGGLVRRKNVLSILAQCLGLAGVVTVLWWLLGYSLVFSKGNGFIGGTQFAMFAGVEYAPNTTYSAWTSHNIWAIFQLTFAIITPALTIGAIAERMRFSAVMLFSVLWMFVVYFPVAHMLWGEGGMFNGMANPDAAVKAIDFAGGIVVHMTSGWSALILCILLGKRRGHGKTPMPPHSMVLCATGTGMLWVGWYGFNAGSAGGADLVATTAFIATTLSAAVGCLVWGVIEYLQRGKPSVLGLCSGAIGGLATITPASGFVSPNAAVVIGLIAGVTTWFACAKIKVLLKYDDALDTFGVHAVGGTIGIILAGIFANSKYNPNLGLNLSTLVGNGLWLEQLKAAAAILVWSVLASTLLYFLVNAIVRCRPTADEEEQGLDLADHGEEGYIEDPSV